jgi:hypothetical protein
MKGVIFTEFVDWAEQQHGLAAIDDVLARASKQRDGAYAATGDYDWRELAGLVGALADVVVQPPAQILRAYGRHLFGALVARFPEFAMGADSCFDMFERIESYIHPEVRKLYPGAELPSFRAERRGNQLQLVYTSPRPFRDFAFGLIEGCVARFDPAATVQCTGSEHQSEFLITVPEGATCPTLLPR